ncbi:MAG: penicillin-binding protein 2 [Candidatus Kuenenbacteria bacterium]
MSEDNPFIIKEKVGKVKGFSRIRDEGDSFMIGKTGELLNTGIGRKKVIISFWVICMCVLAIILRLFWLQIVMGNEYASIAEGNRVRVTPILAERGIIYDRFNKPLVKNVPNLSLFFIPADLPKEKGARDKLASQLSDIIHMDSNGITELLDGADFESYLPEVIKDNLDQEEIILFKTWDDRMPGVRVKIDTRRHYLEGSALAHVLGYVGKINSEEIEFYKDSDYRIDSFIGKDGIELFYENSLKGKDGKQEIEVDALGKVKKILNEVKPITGSDIVLSIDIDLQRELTDSLKKAIEISGTRAGGVGIAIDPQSGEILALVSLPDFDNNFFSAGIDKQAYNNYLTDSSQSLFNRAISGTYPPGSTFKPIVAVVALEEGLVDESKTFLSTGGIQVNKWFFPDWKYGGHGRVNITRAISESVNTFFYYIGGGYNDFTGLGVDKITAYAREFGMGGKLGIDLPGEAEGFLPSKKWKEDKKGESWYIGDTYHLAIGQGDILATPLQIVSFISTIANGGALYRPHLIKYIGGEDATADDNYIIAQDFIRKDNLEIIKKGLRQAVTSGSAKFLADLPVAVAGKTGTAQVGGDEKSHAWFVGFAPYESPRIAIVILIENGGEGSITAVPVFKEVVEWYFSS